MDGAVTGTKASNDVCCRSTLTVLGDVDVLRFFVVLPVVKAAAAETEGLVVGCLRLRLFSVVLEDEF